MCGIFCVNSDTIVKNQIIQGLQFLEYRGYDSAGLAFINKDKFTILKSLGEVSNLNKKIEKDSEIGIGHTRWATHGKVNLSNTHPISNNNIALVHNGIIENYKKIKDKLIQLNYKFNGDTDTEAILNLMQYYIDLTFNYVDAFKQTINDIQGNYAIATIFSHDQHYIFCAKNGSPLSIGSSNTSNYIASDINALALFVDKVITLEDGDIAIVGKNSLKILDNNNNQVTRTVKTIIIKKSGNDLGQFPNFLLKEINDQPKVLKKIISNIIYNKNNHLPNIKWNNVKRISIVACGSSYNAGILAKYWFEDYARIPVDIEFASEFRSRNIIYDKRVIYIFISQSGETLDTLTALKNAKQNSVTTIGLINDLNSAISNLADYIIPIAANNEVSVAATKSFLAQLMQLLNLVLIASKEKHLISKSFYDQSLINMNNDIIHFKRLITINDQILRIAKLISNSQNILFIGRNTMYPICLEGALKLKELSYLPVFAFAAGELKHGSIALIDENSLVIALAPKNKTYHKMISNVEEVRARGAKVILLTDSKENLDVECLFKIFHCSEILTPLFYTIPIQLFAYQVALDLGKNVDRPRNLAKSVTVE